jgi:hypothetical protein
MFAGCLNRHKNLAGYLNGLFDSTKLKARHDQLAQEMLRRGYKHDSPLPYFNDPQIGYVFSEKENLAELRKRCKDCRRIQNRIKQKEKK